MSPYHKGYMDQPESDVLIKRGKANIGGCSLEVRSNASETKARLGTVSVFDTSFLIETRRVYLRGSTFSSHCE